MCYHLIYANTARHTLLFRTTDSERKAMERIKARDGFHSRWKRNRRQMYFDQERGASCPDEPLVTRSICSSATTGAEHRSHALRLPMARALIRARTLLADWVKATVDPHTAAEAIKIRNRLMTAIDNDQFDPAGERPVTGSDEDTLATLITTWRVAMPGAHELSMDSLDDVLNVLSTSKAFGGSHAREVRTGDHRDRGLARGDGEGASGAIKPGTTIVTYCPGSPQWRGAQDG